MARNYDYSKAAQLKWWSEVEEKLRQNPTRYMASNDRCTIISPQAVPHPDGADLAFDGTFTLMVRPGDFELDTSSQFAQTFIPTGKISMAAEIEFTDYDGTERTAYAEQKNVHWHTHHETPRVAVGESRDVKELGKAPRGSLQDRIEMHAVLAATIDGMEPPVHYFAVGKMIAPNQEAEKNPELEKMVELLKSKDGNHATEEDIELDLTTIFQCGKYKATGYRGSLTVPGGEITVVHIVPSIESDLHVSSEQVNEMRKHHKHNAALVRPNMGSHRPTTFGVNVNTARWEQGR